jgi:hypothetical protein
MLIKIPVVLGTVKAAILIVLQQAVGREFVPTASCPVKLPSLTVHKGQFLELRIPMLTRSLMIPQND